MRQIALHLFAWGGLVLPVTTTSLSALVNSVVHLWLFGTFQQHGAVARTSWFSLGNSLKECCLDD